MAVPPSGWHSSAPVPAADEEGSRYLLGRAYFDTREHARAHHVLRDASDDKSHFLASYALYLSGEARRIEQAAASVSSATQHQPDVAPTPATAAAVTPAAPVTPSNPHLAEVTTRAQSRANSCGFSAFLLGVCLRASGAEENALRALGQAVQLEPCLWSAWWELARVKENEKFCVFFSYVD